MTKSTALLVSVVLVIAVAAIVAVRAGRVAKEPEAPRGAEHMSPMPAGAPADQVLGLRPGREPEYRALVAQSKAQLPEVKRRFRAGLPAGHKLFVTTRMRETGTEEQFFVQVLEWTEQGARGVIASELVHIRGAKFGDATLVLDSAIVDWTISRPDGTEEGNALGKFLEAQ